jgi:hypothetical protein
LAYLGDILQIEIELNDCFFFLFGKAREWGRLRMKPNLRRWVFILPVFTGNNLHDIDKGTFDNF